MDPVPTDPFADLTPEENPFLLLSKVVYVSKNPISTKFEDEWCEAFPSSGELIPPVPRLDAALPQEVALS